MGTEQLAELALKYIQQKKQRDATKVHDDKPCLSLLQLKPAEWLGVRKGHMGGQEPSAKVSFKVAPRRERQLRGKEELTAAFALA